MGGGTITCGAVHGGSDFVEAVPGVFSSSFLR